ncbi:MAG: NAD-dependent epimerase/dehydratase family protein [Cyanobacteria bacterium]|nr:NAD-dependent epimerase/dehydratase family protein [Cyanobacteriota bacterium]
MSLIEMAGRRVMLIGGAGFIGHNLALELKRRGAEVSIVDGLQVNNLLSLYTATNTLAERELYLSILNERLELLRSADIPVHVEDARDYFRLGLLFSELKPDVVVLLAAVSHASRSNKDPYHTFDHSFRTLENALDSSRSRVEHFIYFSSSMVYGNFEGDAVDEETNCNPLGIYGALKFGGEKLVIAYNQVFGLPYTIVRPSALYGERCISRRVGQVFIENAMRDQGLVIKGDGTDCLDFTYIGDLVNGICCCITHPEAKNQIFNLTYGQGRSLNDMAGIIKDEFPGIQVQYQERDSLMPERGTLNVDKARELIGYEPQFPLEVGYRHYIQWYRELFERVKTTPHVTAFPQVNE